MTTEGTDSVGFLKGKWSTPWGFVDWGDTSDEAGVKIAALRVDIPIDTE
jgi:hypothetical protein